jgi:Tol biopolymer transport system component
MHGDSMKQVQHSGSSQIDCPRNALVGCLLLIGLLLSGCAPEEEIVFVKDLYDRDPALYVMDPYGNQIERLTGTCIRGATSPVWSPDGERIAFGCTLRDGTADLCVIPKEGLGYPRCEGLVHLGLAEPSTSGCGGDPTSVAWAPDGQRIAFTRGFGSVCIARLEGELECWSATVIGENLSIRTLDWSPVAERLVVAMNTPREVYERIYTVDPDGSNATFLTQGRLPSWSPNGKRLAFFSDGLYVMDATGENHECVLAYPKEGSDAFQEQLDGRLPGFVSRPSWSRDGLSVVFSGSPSSSGGLTAIYVVRLRTGEIRRITEYNDGDFQDPDWSR